MTSGPIFTDAQLKLWMRRVQTEMSKGTAPQETLDLVKQAMRAQPLERDQDFPAPDMPQSKQKTSL